jgi:hypothetical protein
VCNGCKKRAFGCTRPLRFEYKAAIADAKAKTRRGECRTGVGMGREGFERAMDVIRPAIARGMSPYEVAVAYRDRIGVSMSTIYRWAGRGYGGAGQYRA